MIAKTCVLKTKNTSSELEFITSFSPTKTNVLETNRPGETPLTPGAEAVDGLSLPPCIVRKSHFKSIEKELGGVSINKPEQTVVETESTIKELAVEAIIELIRVT